MRFTLLDRVVAVDPGRTITAVKTVTLSEEYLADHFPGFPVLPGVLMLEAMTQAAAWTIRLGEDFAHSIVVLRTARNVKYGDFAEPGKTLTVTAEVLSQDETTTKVKASGMIGDRTSLTARLVLERYNLADRQPHGAAVDVRVRSELRRLWSRPSRLLRDGDPRGRGAGDPGIEFFRQFIGPAAACRGLRESGFPAGSAAGPRFPASSGFQAGGVGLQPWVVWFPMYSQFPR